MRKSSSGRNPFGQRGQSGHDKPRPDAETYPPMNIKEYKTMSDASARYCSRKIILL